MSWWEGPLLGLDTETSGIDVWNDRIVTVSRVLVDLGDSEQRPFIDTQLVDVDIEIPAAAAEVHGITTEVSREFGKDAEEVLDITASAIAVAWGQGIPVVAFNAAFDFSILSAELERHGLQPITERAGLGGQHGPILDPHVLDKQMSRRRGPRTLTATCEHYGVVMSATGAHDASTDALAAVRLLPRMAAAYADLRNSTPEHLTQLQVGWRREQMRSLRAYFDRSGKPHDGCDGGWPLRTDRPAMAVTR